MQHSYNIPGVRASLDLVEMHDLAPGAWCLTRVEVARNLRGQGIASRLLRMVTDAADAEGTTLYLAVEPDESHGLDAETLAAWYTRYGFKPHVFGELNDSESIMRRDPQIPSVSPQRSAGSDDATTHRRGA